MKTFSILFLLLALCALASSAQTNVPDQRLSDFVQIHNVLVQVAYVDGRYRPFTQRINALEKIDVAKCPGDFRAAWNAFLAETKNNFKVMQKKNSDVLTFEGCAVVLSWIEPSIAEKLANEGLMLAVIPPEAAHAAVDRLKAVIRKYETP